MPARRTVARRELDRGQAAVELALALPLVIVLVLGVVQVVVIVRGQLAVELAARDAARAASVAADPAAAASSAAASATPLAPLSVTTAAGGREVTVVVTYRDPTDVMLVGAFIGPVELTAKVTMVREPP